MVDWYRPHPDLLRALSQISSDLSAGMPQAFQTSIDAISVPTMATGATPERFRILSEVAALDLSLGRVFEGHMDALDIMRAGGGEPRPGSYGVWTAETPLLTAIESSQGWRLDGTKPYASGVTYLDHALVTALVEGKSRLFEIDVSTDGLQCTPDTWPSVGMAASASFTLAFDDVAAVGALGAPEFYLQRPGFWQGSINVAACWFGGALGLGRGVLSRLDGDNDSHRWAAFGALSSELELMQGTLIAAARETDLDPLDATGRAKQRAFATRQQVYSSAGRVSELASQLGGTSGFTHDVAQSRRLADLPIYLRQYHPGPDAETLGRLSFERYSHG